jgi:hypothetical protein
MTNAKNDLRTCRKGHRYYKSSDCPTCPLCERERKPENGFLSLISAPSGRAFEREGIITLRQLSGYSHMEILKLHGIGLTTLQKLYVALIDQGLNFRKE